MQVIIDGNRSAAFGLVAKTYMGTMDTAKTQIAYHNSGSIIAVCAKGEEAKMLLEYLRKRGAAEIKEGE